MDEIKTLISTCKVHLYQCETLLELDEPAKAEIRSLELAETATQLSNALYRMQRRSGEVNHE